MSTNQDYFKYREQALGRKPAGLLLVNCRLVNVLSGRIEENATIAVSGSRIVGIGDYQAGETVDLGGQYVYPGLMDAHIHLESSKLTIPQLARIMSRNGTTTVFTDPHEIANVASMEGISYQLDTAAHNGRMSVYFTAPSCVPAIPDSEIETFSAYLGPSQLKSFFAGKWFVVLGEMMNTPGAILGDNKVLEKIAHFRSLNLPVDGHAPLLSGKELNAYIYLGIGSDHESTHLEEAQEKLDRGLHVIIREGSTESNLLELLPIVNEYNSSRIMFGSDDIDPLDLHDRGHINYILRTAVANGLDPIRAIQMATINTAQYFRRWDIGAIFPGARADLVVAPNLEEFVPTSVMRGGKFVYLDGEEQPAGEQVDRFLRSTMNAYLPSTADLGVQAEARKVRVIGIIENQIVTEEHISDAKIENGLAVSDIENDIIKVAVFERHRNSGSFCVGFIKGLGIRRGAVGSSVAHDSHNIIVAGVDDESIISVANRIRQLQGGQVAVSGTGEAAIPLPVAGLMSDATFEDVVEQERKFNTFCSEVLGTGLKSPVSTLSFMALPVIPLLKITDRGIIKVEPGKYPRKVPLFVE